MSRSRLARLERGGPGDTHPLSSPRLVEHFFRHEYGRLVALLVSRFGPSHLEDIEDAAQSALMTALERWTATGQPDNPAGWLYRVAHRNLLSELRQRSNRKRLLEQNVAEFNELQKTDTEVFSEEEIRDDLLRMLFACCDDSLPPDSQLALALKTLCGFDVREIALRLFTSEANIYKRLERARNRLRETPFSIEALDSSQYVARLPAVHRILYLLFTEGYLSSRAESAIRTELCNEAIRLASLVAEHPALRTPETCALLAVMHLHAARLGARQDNSGGLLLLEEQDRTLWDPRRIAIGMDWLAQSATGDSYSRYHAEAGIAAEHCLAPSFRETRWEKVADCYELLERIEPSALHRLNRAVAVSEWQGPAAGLAIINDFVPPGWLTGSYLWAAVLADLHRRCGHLEDAQTHREAALKLAPNAAIADALRRRLAPE